MAIVVGVALILGGVAKITTAGVDDGDERFVVGLEGLTNVIAGVLALSWPTLTVLVLAVVFGAATFLFGVGQIAIAVKLRAGTRGVRAGERIASERPWPRRRRWIGALVAFALALGGVAVSVAVDRAQPNGP